MTTCHLILRKCGCSDLPLSFFWESREALLYSNDLKVRELLFERDGHVFLYCQKHDSNWKRSRFSFLPVFSGHSYKRGAERSSFPSSSSLQPLVAVSKLDPPPNTAGTLVRQLAWRCSSSTLKTTLLPSCTVFSPSQKMSLIIMVPLSEPSRLQIPPPPTCSKPH